MTILGTPGNDNLTGTSGDDSFDLTQGGDDTVQGLGGNDLFLFGHTLTAADSIDGGDGTDTVRIFGDYTGANALTFGASTLTNVDFLVVKTGSFTLTMNDGNVAARASLKVDASALTASQVLTFDGSAELDGHFRVTGGQGNDVITGGAGPDTFVLVRGGDDNVNGGAGNDTFQMGASLTATDTIAGGTGADDVLQLNGAYSGANAVTFDDNTIRDIDVIQVLAGHSYTLTTADSNVPAGAIMTVDASALTGTDFLNFNGSADTNAWFHFIGGAGNDTLTGSSTQNTSGDNFFDLTLGGNDTATGASRFDFFFMGAALNAADKITGSSNPFISMLEITGDYTGANALVANATTFRNITEFDLGAGFNYDITENNANVAAGKVMAVISGIGGSNTAIFDGSAETDGSFNFFTDGGSVTFIGGAQADQFNDPVSSAAIFQGGAGKDLFEETTDFNVASQLDGGAGSDTLELFSSASLAAGLVLGATTLTSIERITFLPGQTAETVYHLTENDGDLAAGATMAVDARGDNTHSDTVIFDGSAETDGHFAFYLVNTTSIYSGGAQSDSFTMNGNTHVTLAGNGGADTFALFAVAQSSHTETLVYNAVSDSTSTVYDVITGLNTANVTFQTSGIGGAATGVDTKITEGTLNTATFDSDLAGIVNAGHLAAHHAVLFTADSGTLNGHTFLVVDENGTAGYQAGADLVIEVTGITGTLTTANFS